MEKTVNTIEDRNTKVKNIFEKYDVQFEGDPEDANWFRVYNLPKNHRFARITTIMVEDKSSKFGTVERKMVLGGYFGSVERIHLNEVKILVEEIDTVRKILYEVKLVAPEMVY